MDSHERADRQRLWPTDQKRTCEYVKTNMKRGNSHSLERKVAALKDAEERSEMKLNKTPAEERDIFRPELFYNYINLRLKNN